MGDSNGVGWHREPALPVEDPRPAQKRGRRVARGASESDAAATKMRITCQFRHEQAMVYELRADTRQIEVRVQAARPAEQGWDVALLVTGESARGPLRGVGATRLVAMEALESASPDALPAQDWADLREALVEVRALD